jgi:hypothetical protein
VSFSYSGGSAGSNVMPARCAGGTATMTALAATSPRSEPTASGAIDVPLDAAHDRVQHHTLAELFGHPQRNLLCAIGEAVLLGAALDVEHAAESARRP